MLRLFRLYSALHRWNVPVLPRLLYMLNRIVFSVVLPPSVQLGRGVSLAYQGLGVVVHGRARIGAGVYIGPQVIIGGRSGESRVPVIEDNCFIGAGSRILGPVTIGAGATVAAGALVIADVAAGATVAGVPARPIRSTRKESSNKGALER